LFDAGTFGKIKQGQLMIDMAMHTTIAKQSGYVQIAVVFAGMGDGIEEGVIMIKTAIFDATVDTGNVLHYHKTSAEVEMPDFRIPHLPHWQADMFFGCINQGTRASGTPMIEIGRVGLFDCITNNVSTFTESIKDGQQYRTWARIRHEFTTPRCGVMNNETR
jgi:hypothetical protein